MDNGSIFSVDTLNYYKRSAERFSGSLERIAHGKRVPGPKTDPAAWREITAMEGSTRRLEVFSANLERAGMSIRAANTSMEASSKHLGLLENTLREALDAGEGSDTRTRKLQDYNRIHPLLDDLARPPEPGARRLLDDPELHPEAGDLRVEAGEGGLSVTIQHRPIHSGPEGLDVPLIDDPATAEDGDLEALIGRVAAARENLEEKMTGLAADALAVTEGDDFGKSFINRDRRQAEALNLPDLNAEAALANAFQLRNSVAVSGLSTLFETHRAALRLLG